MNQHFLMVAKACLDFSQFAPPAIALFLSFRNGAMRHNAISKSRTFTQSTVSESDVAFIALRTIQSVLNKCACRLRPERPPVNSPGRQAGVKDMTELSANGAAPSALYRFASLSRPDGRAYCLSALRALLPYEHSFVTLCIKVHRRDTRIRRGTQRN